MKKNPSTKQFRLGAKDVTIEAIVFQKVDETIVAVPSHSHSEAHPELLQSCYWTRIGKGILIRSGRIDTELHLQCLEALVAGRAARLSCCQLDEIEEHWGQITGQHGRLILSNQFQIPLSRVVHLSTPFPHFFHFPPDARILPKVKEQLRHLPFYINMEGLLQYSCWVFFAISKVFDTFRLDATEEFSLAGKIVDLKNELYSLFLQDNVNGIKEILVNLAGNPAISEIQRFTIEKELVILRGEIKLSLQRQYHLYEEILLLIQKIFVIHPELNPLAELIVILKALIGSEVDIAGIVPSSWVGQMIWIQLLNRRLGVVSSMNCAEGGGQTNFVFALSLAISAIDEEMRSKELLELFVNWDTDTHMYNRKVDLSAAPLIERIRSYVYEILSHFVVGIESHEVAKGMIQDPDFLNLLPTHMVEYDQHSGVPMKLGPKFGSQLLRYDAQ